MSFFLPIVCESNYIWSFFFVNLPLSVILRLRIKGLAIASLNKIDIFTKKIKLYNIEQIDSYKHI